MTSESFGPETSVTATNSYSFDPGGLGILTRALTTGGIDADWQGTTNALGQIATETTVLPGFEPRRQHS